MQCLLLLELDSTFSNLSIRLSLTNLVYMHFLLSWQRKCLILLSKYLSHLFYIVSFSDFLPSLHHEAFLQLCLCKILHTPFCHSFHFLSLYCLLFYCSSVLTGEWCRMFPVFECPVFGPPYMPLALYWGLFSFKNANQTFPHPLNLSKR